MKEWLETDHSWNRDCMGI